MAIISAIETKLNLSLGSINNTVRSPYFHYGISGIDIKTLTL
jgi:hypothetical protein